MFSCVPVGAPPSDDTERRGLGIGDCAAVCTDGDYVIGDEMLAELAEEMREHVAAIEARAAFEIVDLHPEALGGNTSAHGTAEMLVEGMDMDEN